MFPVPRPALRPNSFEAEALPLVKPTGFREYDARWLFPEEINPMGVQALGLGIGTLAHELGAKPDVVVGHDFRAYSAGVKLALVAGLTAAGMRVKDIGLCLSPMAYFAQFALDAPCVAMVTASHNENGWTGVKMGVERPLTFGPDEMARLREIVLAGAFRTPEGGAYAYVPDLAERYLADLASRPRLSRRLRVVAACGNGTAGAFAPRALAAIGCEVVPMDVEADYTFPRYNPNPEDLAMLHALAARVRETGADLGFGFDGDGDRCGVVDGTGREIFSDKLGVILARDLAARHPEARFVADVKSTGLFASDPVLARLRARTEYWKTGHSYMKRRVAGTGALMGFEKSGHFFPGPPLGRGYDDGLLTAILVCELLDRNPEATLASLHDALPRTWGTPTMSAPCPDEAKYGVVEAVLGRIEALRASREPLAGGRIAGVVTVNGVRATLEDGTWGLVRASSNKPELVVVAESPVSEARTRAMTQALDALLREHPEVGAYNQTI